MLRFWEPRRWLLYRLTWRDNLSKGFGRIRMTNITTKKKKRGGGRKRSLSRGQYFYITSWMYRFIQNITFKVPHTHVVFNGLLLRTNINYSFGTFKVKFLLNHVFKVLFWRKLYSNYSAKIFCLLSFVLLTILVRKNTFKMCRITCYINVDIKLIIWNSIVSNNLNSKSFDIFWNEKDIYGAWYWGQCVKCQHDAGNTQILWKCRRLCFTSYFHFSVRTYLVQFQSGCKFEIDRFKVIIWQIFRSSPQFEFQRFN